MAVVLFQVTHDGARPLSRTRHLYSANEIEEHSPSSQGRRFDHSPGSRVLRLSWLLECSSREDRCLMGFESLLIERCKRMTILLEEADKSIEPNQKFLMEAAVIGCNALKDLAVENISNEFRQAVRQLEEARRQSRAEFVAITQN